MDTLFTPWRYAYVSALQPADDSAGCFFCAAALDPGDPARLVVHVAAHHLLMLNRHPYTSGHLMVAPLEHVASPQAASPEARAEFWPLVLRGQRVLERAYSPHGFNFGMNLGRPAGAGVPSHYHFHLVPRWEGDTNFMSVVGGARVVPEDLLAAQARLSELFAEPGI